MTYKFFAISLLHTISLNSHTILLNMLKQILRNFIDFIQNIFQNFQRFSKIFQYFSKNIENFELYFGTKYRLFWYPWLQKGMSGVVVYFFISEVYNYKSIILIYYIVPTCVHVVRNLENFAICSLPKAGFTRLRFPVVRCKLLSSTMWV